MSSVIPQGVRAFAAERHLATLTTMRPDGSPHVVPVGFTLQDGTDVVRVITVGTSRKAAHVREGGRAAVCWVDGGRWATLEGSARVVADAEGVRLAERLYAAKYRGPAERSDRVAIEMVVDRVLASASLTGPAPV